MQDLDKTTEHNSQPQTAKPNLLHDWWEEIYPREFLLTFKNYFFNHKKFFDEVFDEQWDNKVKPMAFVFAAIGISLIIGSISPWGLTFSAEPPQPSAWQQITNNMATEDFDAFYETFELEDFDEIVDSASYYLAVNNRLMEQLGMDRSPTVKDLQNYFEEEGNDLLAIRAEYVSLKQQVEHDELIKSQEFTEVEQIIVVNLFFFYSMFFWLVSHQFFKRAQRTSRETVIVYMYSLGMLIFFVYVPLIAIAGSTDEDLLSNAFLVVLALLVLMLYKIFSIFKYTHNTGFLSLVNVFTKSFLWPIFMIPILLRWGFRKIRGDNKESSF